MINDDKPQFEYHGCFEDVFDLRTRTCLGTRKVAEQPGRAFGYAGRREEIVTEPLKLQRGHKEIVIKASKENPLHIQTTLQHICGRMLRNIHPEDALRAVNDKNKPKYR